MSRDIVIRCVNDSETVDFYDEEVPDMTIKHNMKSDLQFYEESQNPANIDTNIIYLSKGYMEITLDLHTKYSDTYSKLDTIAGWQTDGQPTPFKMYYEYIIDSAEAIWVQMIPETNIKIYAHGVHASTSGEIKPVFIQSQPSGVGVIYKPQDLVGT